MSAPAQSWKKLWLTLQFATRMNPMCATARHEENEAMKADAVVTLVGLVGVLEEQMVSFFVQKSSPGREALWSSL